MGMAFASTQLRIAPVRVLFREEVRGNSSRFFTARIGVLLGDEHARRVEDKTDLVWIAIPGQMDSHREKRLMARRGLVV